MSEQAVVDAFLAQINGMASGLRQDISNAIMAKSVELYLATTLNYIATNLRPYLKLQRSNDKKMDYRRVWHQGGTYFFTVNLLQRKGNDLLVRYIQPLREAVKAVKARHPFEIHGLGGVAGAFSLCPRTSAGRCRLRHPLAVN